MRASSLLPLLPLLLLPLVIPGGGARRAWIPLRVASRWAAVREREAGREYWLRPECRLEDVPPKGCASEWVVSVTFWSPEWLAQVERALRASARCKRRRADTPCALYPFQTARVSLFDQQAQWSSDKVRFVNGPLPPKLQFRLRRRTKASAANCSFEEDDLVIEMSDERRSLDDQTIFINGYEVRAAYQTLDKWEAQQKAGAVARRLGHVLLRQKAPGASIAAADHLERSLASWAAWGGLPAGAPRPRNSTQGAQVFRRFPLTALLPVRGVAKPSVIQRFSVTASPNRGLRAQPNRRAAGGEEADKLASMQQRLSDLESFVTRLAFNSSNATTSPPSRSLPFLTYVNTSSTDRASFYANSNIRSIDDCAEAFAQVQFSSKSKTSARGLKKSSLFYLRPIKRLVRCSENGELVVLQRQKNNVDFNRSWADYRRGFGDPATGDFWLGLEFLANYTAKGDVCASIELIPWRLNVTNLLIQYSDFEVASEHRNFRLWYDKSSGHRFTKDALMENRGQSFSTYDRDRDTFVGNCARVFGGGNWFKSCTRANIFGRLDVKAGSGSMCWTGVHPSQGDMCSPLTAIAILVRRASQTAGARKVIFSSIASNADNCKCRIEEVRINATGLYRFTAGGAPGGASKREMQISRYGRSYGTVSLFLRPGGRGALVRTDRLLRAGTRLRLAVGCPGTTGTSYGHGGDATWVTALGSTSKLLVVAGGGGGGGTKSRGTHGRAVKSGHKANEVFSSARVTKGEIMGMAKTSRGRGWQHLKILLLNKQRNTISKDATTGVKSYAHGRRGGGGGGGYEGGVSGGEESAGGGGGGSFCDQEPKVSCEVTEGGNFHNTGFVIVEKQVCF